MSEDLVAISYSPELSFAVVSGELNHFMYAFVGSAPGLTMREIEQLLYVGKEVTSLPHLQGFKGDRIVSSRGSPSM
jgi:hypothetical protein